MLELLHDRLVDCVALMVQLVPGLEKEVGEASYKVFDSTRGGPQNNWSRIIGLLALGFGINSSEVELLPHLLQKLVNVPAMFRTDGARVRNPVQKVQLLN